MPIRETLAGVYAAVVTPLQADYTLDLDGLTSLLAFLAQRGCDGALLMGTTGEGPSLSTQERLELMRASASIRQEFKRFRLLAGTTTSSLEETITLTRAAFELDMDGVVCLPPYFYKKVDDAGLFEWFSQVIRRAVPADGAVMGYHIPAISGVPFSPDLMARLLEAFPAQFCGLKDSSGDPDHAQRLGERFGNDLLLLVGNDRLFSMALRARYSGCITALANLFSPDCHTVWAAHLRSEVNAEAQSRLDAARQLMDSHPPAPAFLKSQLAYWHHFPRWAVRPPLRPLSLQEEQRTVSALAFLGYA